MEKGGGRLGLNLPETPEQDVAERALSVPEKAQGIIVVDNETYGQAGEVLTVIKVLRKEINAAFDPIISKAHAAHKEAVAQKKKAEAPLVEAEAYIKPQIAGYLKEQERKRQEEEARLRLEAKKKADEDKLKAALAAEKAGDNEEAEAIISDPTPVPPVVLVKSTPKLEGVSVKKIYKFRITDPNKVPRMYMMPDEKTIGAVVRSTKGAVQITGVEIYAEDSVAAGAR